MLYAGSACLAKAGDPYRISVFSDQMSVVDFSEKHYSTVGTCRLKVSCTETIEKRLLCCGDVCLTGSISLCTCRPNGLLFRPIFRAMFFQPYRFSTEPVPGFTSVRASFLLPKPVGDLANFVVAIGSSILHGFSPFRGSGYLYMPFYFLSPKFPIAGKALRVEFGDLGTFRGREAV